MKDKNKDMIKALGTGIVLGGIITGGGVYASTVAASSVSYSNSNSGLSSTSVQGAIDALYTKVKNAEEQAKIPSLGSLSGFYENNIFRDMSTHRACAKNSAPDHYGITVSGSVICKGLAGLSSTVYMQIGSNKKIPVNITDISPSSSSNTREGFSFSINYTCATSRKYSISGGKVSIIVPKEMCGVYKHLANDVTLDTGFEMSWSITCFIYCHSF